MSAARRSRSSSSHRSGLAASGLLSAIAIGVVGCPGSSECSRPVLTVTFEPRINPVSMDEVDLLLMVDNSGSMTQEIQGVEQNINVNFANLIGKSGLDYRVILIAKHGDSAAQQSICVEKPLSRNVTCAPPPQYPVMNPPRFFQYDVEVSSINSLTLAIARYTVPGPIGSNAWQFRKASALPRTVSRAGGRVVHDTDDGERPDVA